MVCECVVSSWNVCDVFQELLEGCKNIRDFSFLGSFNLSDDAFKAIASKKKLRKLKLDST